MVELLRRLHTDDEGATLPEYAIIAAGIAVPALVGFGAIIAACTGVLQTTTSGLTGYMLQ